MSAKKKSATTNGSRQLGDDEVVRLKDGPKHFGVGRSRIAELVAAGEIPKPMRMSVRCVGWFGHQIHAYQSKLQSNEYQQKLEAEFQAMKLKAAKKPNQNRKAS